MACDACGMKWQFNWYVRFALRPSRLIRKRHRGRAWEHRFCKKCLADPLELQLVIDGILKSRLPAWPRFEDMPVVVTNGREESGECFVCRGRTELGALYAMVTVNGRPLYEFCTLCAEAHRVELASIWQSPMIPPPAEAVNGREPALPTAMHRATGDPDAAIAAALSTDDLIDWAPLVGPMAVAFRFRLGLNFECVRGSDYECGFGFRFLLELPEFEGPRTFAGVVELSDRGPLARIRFRKQGRGNHRRTWWCVEPGSMPIELSVLEERLTQALAETGIAVLTPERLRRSVPDTGLELGGGPATVGDVLFGELGL